MEVRNILKDASSDHVAAFLSVISLGEIYYIIACKIGEEKAGESVEDISCLPIRLIDVTTERVLAPDHVKAHNPVSYADAIVVATAVGMNLRPLHNRRAIFKEDIFDKRLKTHRLKGNLKEYYAFTISYSDHTISMFE